MHRTLIMRPHHFLIALMLLLFAVPAAQGQTLKRRMAERDAAVFDYPHMAKIYENIIAKGKAVPNDFRQLAFAYGRMEQYGKAADTYKKLIDLGSATPDDLHSYANLLRSKGDYNGALTWYATYALQAPDDQWAKAYTENGDFFKKLMVDSTRNAVRTLTINSTEADLAPALMPGLLIFSSARGEGVGGRTRYKWDQEPFLNLYSALLDSGGIATDPVVLRRGLNSRFHDGTATFDSTRQRLYFTRDNFVNGKIKKAKNGELKLGIYFADIHKGEFGQPEWGDVQPFAFNDPEYNFGQPSISPDGKRLYFVSDMTGGSGGTDIWYCNDQGGLWSTPKNIGPEVNTPGDEMYPFITADSTLYFSSNGQAGLGGYDIFTVQLKPTGTGHVFNMGYPINTSSNDRGMILMADDSTGFFFSDRPGGMGSDDIYGCTVHPPVTRIAGVVLDKLAQTPLSGYKLEVKDAKGNVIEDAKVTYLEDGDFTIDVPYSPNYSIVATKAGYRQALATLDPTKDDLSNVALQLERYDYGAEGVVQQGDTKAPLDSAVVQLCNANDTVVEQLATGPDGKYQFALQPEAGYRIKVSKDGFFKQSARITTKGKSNTVIHTDFNLFPLKVDQVVRLDNIYYDVAKWNIRPDAGVELDKLVQTLIDNPTVKIELSSHTDCRGKDAYNMTLSEKRAQSAVDYVVKQGIDKDRLVAKGYGETRPVEPCECGKCTDQENQANRRTEFKVLSK
ncbi:MAG: carboxypeptidase regulatory-like domain-containing protein [Flavobacteriales bacterium]